jgi:atypical dual specificity phosphatase
MFWHVSTLQKLGIKAVVNMMDEYGGPHDMYLRAGISQLYLPTVDHCEPSLEHLHKGVEFIQYHKSRNNGVYIHCKR